MWFVLSKPIEQFSDCSIKVALSHYYNILNNEREIGETDSNSPMEKNVLHWLLSCKFYLDNKEYIEIIIFIPDIYGYILLAAELINFISDLIKCSPTVEGLNFNS